MTETNYLVRLPPEGTGKRLHSRYYTILAYDNGTSLFENGDIILGASSGATGEVITISGSVSTGNLVIVRDRYGATPDFINNEELSVDGYTKALAADTGTPFYQPVNHISGGNNIDYTQYVDRLGAAYVRFQEGPQLLDASGVTRTSSMTILGDYSLEYGDDAYTFQNSLTALGSEAIVENSDESSVLLRVGTTNGERITRTTHKYHIYTPGLPQLSEMTVQISDTKADVIRNWGYFDAYNGFMFRQNGSTFSVVIRSNTTGTPVETVINQSVFNKDKVDGSGGLDNNSGVTLDVTKLNLYFIGALWLGAGRVRFGAILNGERIVMHEFDAGGILVSPFSSSATLPLRWEIENTATTAGTSELKSVCAMVASEGLQPSSLGRLGKTSKSFASDLSALGTIGSTETPMAGFRVSILTSNGRFNRKAIIPTSFDLFTSTSPIILRMYKNPEFAGGTWTQIPNTLVEFNQGITSVSGGIEIISKIIPVGQYTYNITEIFSYFGEYGKILADGTGTDEYIMTAQKVGSGSDATLDMFTFNWYEFG